jgi:hypothetical protein
MSRRIQLVILPLAVLAVACSETKTGNNRDTMTKRQRDSVFGQSAIPNAGAVTQAMKAADSIAARQKRLDSAMVRPDTI